MRTLAVAVLLLGLSLPAAAREFVAKEKDFKCLQKFKKIEGHDFVVSNRNAARLRIAKAIARGKRLGKDYPVGTVIQLVPFEAMVKRGGSYNPEGHGWEFFRLGVSAEGTQIVARGGAEVVNGAGSCQGCHVRVAPNADLVCEVTLGPGSLFPSQVALSLQQNDPRCPH